MTAVVKKKIVEKLAYQQCHFGQCPYLNHTQQAPLPAVSVDGRIPEIVPDVRDRVLLVLAVDGLSRS
ncbi:hypothetical protein EMCRGX_G009108 [Ephydatia muelleri]